MSIKKLLRLRRDFHVTLKKRKVSVKKLRTARGKSGIACSMCVADFINGKELSNFWQAEVVIDKRHYPSGESAFHGSKYIIVSRSANPERQKILEDLISILFYVYIISTFI